uniref:Uncharacterized protein n=1 Tax=Ananas comosus var. bracteatus TaxID=296719 RepID=A0A6V7PSB5_ANACO|nr:unnamed protein product [Ananas comosus var. bracteatus]
MAPALTSNSFRLTSGPLAGAPPPLPPRPRPQAESLRDLLDAAQEEEEAGRGGGDANSNSNPNPARIRSRWTSSRWCRWWGRRRRRRCSRAAWGGGGRMRRRCSWRGPRGRQALGSPAAFSGAASPCGPACPTSPPRRSSPASPPPISARPFNFRSTDHLAGGGKTAERGGVGVRRSGGDREGHRPRRQGGGHRGPRREVPLSRRCRRIGGHHRRRPPGVRAAELAGVGHVAVVYDAGTGGVAAGGASTYNVLDGITSFFANLFAQSQPLTLGVPQQGAETDVSYTLIKASLTDDYAAEGSYGLVVSQEGSTPAGTTARYKVSRSQIATLVADVFSNTAVAENKVVQVSTSPSAASKPIDELFGAVPEDGRRRAYQEALAKAKAEEEEALSASQKAREAAEAAKKLEKEVKKLSEQEAQSASLAQEARERAEAAGTSLENLMDRAKGFGKDFSWRNLARSSKVLLLKSLRKRSLKHKLPPLGARQKQKSCHPKKQL